MDPLGAVRAARGHLFPFVPVLMALGIGLWVALPLDPGAAALALSIATLATGAALGLRGPEDARPLATALACIAAGFLLADWRSDRVAAPILPYRIYGPVEGRIIGIDRSASDRLRVTLDQVALGDLAPDRTPARVRVSLHGDQVRALEPGQRVMLTANLAPPEGPVEPGGFDFRRHAWFLRLGAVGYSHAPVLLIAGPAPGEARINRLRNRIATAVRTAVPGEAGAFAAAILTGDRSGISQATLQSLRDSNLAHLLAISGLHMGLLTAFVFAALRSGLALVPYVALRVPTKKIAALLALAAAGFYLALSGGNVATQRAFVMVAVMLVAVLVDRRAFSLRSVALAAVIILAVYPEALTEAGFQMSFSATVALVAAFGALGGPVGGRRLPGWAQGAAVLVFSSAVAGFATAPIAAAQFNRLAEYGLLANILAVPLMGTVLIPAAVAAALLAPLGAAAPALWAMEQGAAWILFVSDLVAGMEGAVVAVRAPPAPVLPLLALGALWAVIWPGGWRVRALGVAPIALAAGLWMVSARPTLLIAPDAAVVGLMGGQGRAVSVLKGGTYAATRWLQGDGATADQAMAAAKAGFTGPKGDRRFAFGPLPAAHLTGKGAAARVTQACTQVVLVILAAPLPHGWRDPVGCQVIDARILARTGALALDLAGGAVRVRPASGAQRRWTVAPGRARSDAGSRVGQGTTDHPRGAVDRGPAATPPATPSEIAAGIAAFLTDALHQPDAQHPPRQPFQTTPAPAAAPTAGDPTDKRAPTPQDTHGVTPRRRGRVRVRLTP